MKIFEKKMLIKLHQLKGMSSSYYFKSLWSFINPARYKFFNLVIEKNNFMKIILKKELEQTILILNFSDYILLE